MSTRFKKNADEVAYLLECDEDMYRFRLTLISGGEITPQMFINALVAFVDDHIHEPEKLFDEMGIMDYPLQ